MGRLIRWRDEAWDGYAALPAALRTEARLAVVGLVEGPLPAPGAVPYEHVPDTYRLDTGHVTLWYRVVGDEVDVVYLRANS